MKIKTINVVENDDGVISITAFPDDANGQAEALNYFHDAVHRHQSMTGCGWSETLDEIKARFSSIYKANYTDSEGEMDIVIVRSR